MASAREEEAAKLFGTEEVPSVPDYGAGEGTVGARNDTPPSEFEHSDYRSNTLDESVFTTIKRDLLRIALNLKLVLLPFLKEDNKNRSLRNWDLWGPLLFMMLFCILLSASHKGSDSKVFAVTFVLMGLGAVILTINVLLLGGTIVFFQSLCLLGYCLFPIVVAAMIVSIVDKWYIVWPVTIAGAAWAGCAAYPFIREASPERKHGLSMYPVILLYLCIGWMVLVM